MSPEPNPTVTRAWVRARRLYPRSSGFQRAYVRGVQAALAGRPPDVCPYRSRGGWKAWRAAWLHGHASIVPADD